MCTLVVTVDICGTSGAKGSSDYSANKVTDVALNTEPEEVEIVCKHRLFVYVSLFRKMGRWSCTMPLLKQRQSRFTTPNAPP